jgi:eukaryotic-like serine/threonine-protein kinase
MEFQFGDWLVSPEANIVSNGDAKTQLEPRVMAVLRYLCRHPGAVIPAEEILQACWGSNELGDNPVHKAITQLRRAFGDSTTAPRYIETIRKRGYRAIAPVVTLAAPPSTTWEGGSPFRGLEAFQENHAAIFFGRVQATAQLRELVLTQAAHGCPMTLILGPSGSGKTSLVRAGLLPQLMAGAIRSDEPIGLSSTVYLDCADLGSGTLFQALAGALIDAEINGEPLFPAASADSLGQQLASDPNAVSSELRERSYPRVSVGVFVDRLEAVFRAQPSDADRFMQAVETLAKSNCLLILMACRNDFYPAVMAQPTLLALKSRGGLFDVLPPDGADIAQIVRQPALATGLTFEKDQTTGAGLDDVICDAARGNPDMLPLLQYTLNELYRQRDESNELKFQIYRQLGGIEGAVGVRAEQVVSALTARQISALPRVLSLLVNIGNEQTVITARRSPLSMLCSEEEKTLVGAMIEARLFVSEMAGDVPSFGVAHEALLRQWPRAIEWTGRLRSALQVRTRIGDQAIRWHSEGCPNDLLVPKGSQLEQARALLAMDDFALSQPELEFINASLSRSKRNERIRFGLMVLITVLSVVSTVLGIAARRAQNQAETHRTEAEELLGYMLGEFAEKLRPLGRLDLLDGVSNRALSYLSSTESLLESQTALTQRAKALQVIAEVNMARENPEKTHEALLAARKILELQEKNGGNDRALLLNLGANAFWLSQYHGNRREWKEAIEQAKEYVRYSDRLAVANQTDPEAWIEQSYAATNMGSILMPSRQIDAAAEAFELAISLKRRALKTQPENKKFTADLSNTLSWLADARFKLGQLNEAKTLYAEEEALIRGIHTSSPNDGFWIYRLANALWHRAFIEIALGQDREASEDLLQSQQLFKTITMQDPSNKKWLLNLQYVQVHRLAMSGQSHPLDTADQLNQLTATLLIQAMAEPRNTRLHALLNIATNTLAPLLAHKGQHREAIAILDAEIARQRMDFSTSKVDESDTYSLADSLITKGELLRSEDKTEGISECTEGVAILGPLAKESHSPPLLVPYLKGLICKGDTAEAELVRTKLRSMGYRNSNFLKYIYNR